MPKVDRTKAGATVPFITYLAKEFETNAERLAPSREYKTLTSEAVGRQAVRLSGVGDYICVPSAEEFNAVTVRYSIPDDDHNAVISGVSAFAATLTLYVGESRYQLSLSTAHSHLYGNFPWSKDRAMLGEHKFFDEVSLLLDRTYKKGTQVRLVKEECDASPSYTINLIETEMAKGPIDRPYSAVSLADFDPIADGTTCNYDALRRAYDTAVASRDKILYLPKGRYYISKRLEMESDGVTICGAGIWHTELVGEICFSVRAKNVTFMDFKMNGNVTVRRDTQDIAAIETERGAEHITIKDVWITHHKVGMWINYASGSVVDGCRCRDLYADGVNLHCGVKNVSINNNHFRATGDDAIAMWSETDCNENNVISNNTVESPWLANAIAVYGGRNSKIQGNLVCDTVYAGSGINISSNFKPTPFGGTVLVENNVLIRCGSKRNACDIGALWFNTVKEHDNRAEVIVRGNTVLDSAYQGIFFEGEGIVDNVTIENNLFDGMTTHFADCVDDAKNKVRFSNNIVRAHRQKKYNNPLGMGITGKEI